MENLVDPALDVNPYGLAVYGFLVAAMAFAIITLWKSNQEKEKKISTFFDRMIEVVEVNTSAIHELKQVITYLKEKNQK